MVNEMLRDYIKQVLLKIKYGYKANSTAYIEHLKKCGIRIGKNTTFYSPWTIMVDCQRPWMIEIGENVHITRNCSILQHGYDWAVLQRMYGEVLGSCGKVKIGNNVFIGTGSIILKGAEIGDNTIIGAGSLINKKLEGNAVYAGVPCKRICSIEEYYQKRKEAQVKEATELVREYKKLYGKYPKKELLREFFFLFEPREGNRLLNIFENVFSLSENERISKDAFHNSEPLFNGYDEFLNYVTKIGGKENV